MCVCPLTQWAKHDPFLPPSPMILPPPPRNDSFVHHPFLISCLLPRCSIIHPCFSRRKPLIFPPKVGNKWTRKKDWGQYLNDIYKIIGFFNPLPPCHCQNHTTSLPFVCFGGPHSPLSVQTSFKYRPLVELLAPLHSWQVTLWGFRWANTESRYTVYQLLITQQSA